MTKSPHDPNTLFAAERPVRSDFARQAGGLSYAIRRLITIAVLLAALVWGGVSVWNKMVPSTPAEIPTVKAEGPYKQKPEQPGGVDIPNQDVQVYHEIDGESAKATTKPVTEHLLPPPETPDLKSEGSAPAPTFFQPASSSNKQVESLSPPEDPIAAGKSEPDPILDQPVKAVQTTVMPSISKPVEVPSAAPVPVPAPAVVAAPVKEAPAKPVAEAKSLTPVSKGQTVVQLAALPDQHAAEVMAQKLEGKYKSILGSAQLHTVRADLGAKGIFYRIQSQTMSEAQAKAICDALKSQKAGCLLVRP